MSAMFDSGYVHSGNVRGLVVHMKTHRIGIRADQTIYFYSRLRKDHIVMNGGDYSDMLGPPDSSGLSASSSSTKAKEREKEKDALSNPTHVVLAEYLKKQLSKDRPTVCAVFRYADQLLGREDGSAGILDRKPHIAHKGAAAAPRRAAVPPSAPVPPVDASSSSQHIHADAAVSSGSSSSSSISSHSSGTKGKNHVDAAGTSANGSGSGSNGNDIGMDGTNGSNTAVSKTAKRPLPILSLLGIINENPPPVDMTRFLQIFLNKPDEPGIKRPRTS